MTPAKPPAPAAVVPFRSKRDLAAIEQLTAEITEFAEEQCALGHMRRAGVTADGRTLYELTAEDRAAWNQDEGK